MAIFILWGIRRVTTKKTVEVGSDLRARLLLGIVLLGWLILFDRRFRPGLLGERFMPVVPVANYAGLALTAIGLGFAAWARFAIGRNWGSLITVQENHELMRSGPYAIVRHPIYAGFMLATLGTAIALGEIGGFISVALVVLAWGYKARLEEAFMIEHFGVEYEHYRQTVKGLIPGIW